MSCRSPARAAEHRHVPSGTEIVLVVVDDVQAERDRLVAAGIDLASWNPRAGVSANRQNLVRSYRFYENLQLSHRELQWAGMGGLVGADFGGGLLDFELATNIYDFARLQPIANAIVGQTNTTLGPVFVDKLPRGLRALARVGATISADDLRKIQGDILVMQKNIFSDLMPMHRAYVVGGLPALDEMHRAGLFDVTGHWAARAAKGSVLRLWLLVVVLATASTIVLSLDTTAVLLTVVAVPLARALALPVALLSALAAPAAWGQPPEKLPTRRVRPSRAL